MGSIYRGAGTTFVGGGNIFIDDRTDMAWYIEVYYKPDATNGGLVTKINGVMDCDYTGKYRSPLRRPRLIISG